MPTRWQADPFTLVQSRAQVLQFSPGSQKSLPHSVGELSVATPDPLSSTRGIGGGESGFGGAGGTLGMSNGDVMPTDRSTIADFCCIRIDAVMSAACTHPGVVQSYIQIRTFYTSYFLGITYTLVQQSGVQSIHNMDRCLSRTFVDGIFLTF